MALLRYFFLRQIHLLYFINGQKVGLICKALYLFVILYTRGKRYVCLQNKMDISQNNICSAHNKWNINKNIYSVFSCNKSFAMFLWKLLNQNNFCLSHALFIYLSLFHYTRSSICVYPTFPVLKTTKAGQNIWRTM